MSESQDRGVFTFGSLFAGIGGFDLGLERAGMVCKWQVENDPFCNKVLEKHWPHVKRYGDIRYIGDDLEPVDLICGGFPCQDVSLAGKRAGIKEGTRSGLWFEYSRIIRLLRPRYVLVENVPGLLGNGFGRVLGDLAESGYDAEWDCIHPRTFGSPQRDRTRLFLMAYPPSMFSNGGQNNEKCGSSVFQSIPEPGNSLCSNVWRDSDQYLDSARVLRVADGVSEDVDRLRALGNAVVPQVAEFIGRMILEFDTRISP